MTAESETFPREDRDNARLPDADRPSGNVGGQSMPQTIPAADLDRSARVLTELLPLLRNVSGRTNKKGGDATT